METLDLFVLQFSQVVRGDLGGQFITDFLDLLNPAHLEKLLTLPLPTRLKNRVKRGSLRRLACFSDGLGKVRYVAISDWVTQAVLKPLHDLLIGMLRETQQDYT